MSRRLRGLALRYGSASEDMGFVETIRGGALRGADMSETKAYHNHDHNRMLGSVRAGTLELRKTKIGLRYEVDVPSGPTGDDVMASVRRGDLTKSSFSFELAKDADGKWQDKWWKAKDGTIRREIIRFRKIWDVSPVAEPAYKSTSCECG